MNLRHRIEKLEGSLPGGTALEIHITGGIPNDSGPSQASADGFVWNREEEECLDSFMARVRFAACQRGDKIIIFGGLPDK